MCALLALVIGAGLVPMAPFEPVGEAHADDEVKWLIIFDNWRSRGATRLAAWNSLVKSIGADNKRGSLGVEETWPKYSDGTPEEGAEVSYIDCDGKLRTDFIEYYCNQPPTLKASGVTGYVGETKSVNASVNSGGELSYESADESVATVDDRGWVHLAKAGTTTVTVRAASTRLYAATSTTVTVSASRRTSTTTFPYESLSRTYGDAPFAVNPTTTSDSIMSFSSSDPSVASIDGRGTVTINSVGTSTIQAYMYPSTYFEASSATFTLNVGQLPVGECDIQVGSATWNKDASKREPSVTVKHAGKTIDPANYSVSFSDDGTAGQGTVTVSGMKNLTGSASKSYAIGQKDATGANIDLGGSVFEYTGGEVRPVPSIVDDGVLLTPSSYDVTYSDNVKAGEASMRIDFKGNYFGSVTRTFVIGSKMESQLVTGLGNGEFVYTGKPVEPALQVEGADESCYDLFFCEDTVNVGEKSVRIVGKAGYYGQVTLPYRVVARPIDEVSVGEVTYTGAAADPDVSVYADGALVDAGSYDVVVDAGVNVGDECLVHVTGKGNYAGTIDRAYSISPRRIESVSVRSEPKSYDGEPADPALLVLSTLGEVAEGSYTVSYSRNGEPTDDLASAGVIAVSVAGTGNFAGGATAEFEIARASIDGATLEVAGADGGFAYTGGEHRPEVTVSYAGKTLGAQDYSVSYADNVDVGMATVTVEGLGNYAGSLSRQFEIVAASEPGSDSDPASGQGGDSADGGGAPGGAGKGGSAGDGGGSQTPGTGTGSGTGSSAGGGSGDDSNAGSNSGAGGDSSAGGSAPGAPSGNASTGGGTDGGSSDAEAGSGDSAPGSNAGGAGPDGGSGPSSDGPSEGTAAGDPDGTASGDSAADLPGDGQQSGTASDARSGEAAGGVSTGDGGTQSAQGSPSGSSAMTVKDAIAAIGEEGAASADGSGKARITSATLAEARAIYDGTEKMPRVALVSAGDKSVPAGSYYVQPMRGGAVTSDFVSAGTVRVWVVGTGDFEGSVYADYIIAKATPKVAFKSRTKKLSAEKAMKAKKAKRRLVLKATTSGDAKASFKVVKANKRVFLRGNKAILRKKTKPGLYSIIVEASVPESANWNASSKRRIVTFAVK